MPMPRFHVDPPTVAPLRFGLSSVSDVVNRNGGHWQAGIERDDVETLRTLLSADGPCAPNAKTATVNRFDDVAADPFSLYLLDECRAPGTISEQQEFAVTTFSNSEWFALEREFWERATVGADVIGASDDPLCGLAQIEGWIGTTYASGGVIHGSRRAVTILAEKARVRRHGNVLETELGTKVAAGAGYLTKTLPSAPAAGREWLLVTAPVTIHRGNAMVSGPLFAQTPLDNTTNVLVERTNVIDFGPKAGLIDIDLGC